MSVIHGSFFQTWLLDVWSMLAVSAPWLLVGFFGAGLLHAALPRTLIAKHMSRPGLPSVLKASAFGLPLPLCSCSVIPVGVSLRRAGASRGSLASFFVSTPEIGVDSFLLSYVLLGPFFAVLRVVSAFVSAVAAGIGIDLGTRDSAASRNETEQSSCCHSSDNNEPAPEEGEKHQSLLYRSLYFGYVDLLDDIARLLVLGFLLAGLFSTLIPPQAIASLPLEPLWLSVAMLFVSLPVYVCSVSSTPIAAALLAKGVPAGAILVFLLAGPASNVSTMLVIRRELGSKALAIYLLSVAAVALGAASLLDYGLFPPGALQEGAAAALSHGHQANFAQHLLAAVFTVLLAGSLYRTAQKKHKD